MGHHTEKITIAPDPSSATAQKKQQPQDTNTETDKQKILEACQRYLDNLALLKEYGRRVYTVNASGEYHYFSDKEREQHIAATQKNIDMFCVPQE